MPETILKTEMHDDQLITKDLLVVPESQIWLSHKLDQQTKILSNIRIAAWVVAVCILFLVITAILQTTLNNLIGIVLMMLALAFLAGIANAIVHAFGKK